MTGLAYAESRGIGVESHLSRWLAVCVVAALIHSLPLLWFTLPKIQLTEEPEFFAVDFSDLPAIPETSKPAESLIKDPAVSTPRVVAAPSLELPTVAAQPPKETAVTPPPAPSVIPPTATPKTEAPVPAPAVTETKPALHEPDLAPLDPKDLAAFDESKVTKEIPKEGYASDRNSTAADRGPKNLPRGDPYVDKGQSKVIRYLETRGEGNLPAIASPESSGSVKKEGNPDAGKGVVDDRPADKKLPPKSPVAPDEVDPKTKPQEKTVVVKAPDTPEFQPLSSVVTKPAKEETAPEKKIGREKTEDGTEPLAQNPDAKKTIALAPNPEAKNLPPLKVEKTNAPETPHPDETSRPGPTEKPRRNTAEDELAAFAALIDGKGKREGRGGDYGDNAGVPGREGSKGHEGDGTLRPGHDEAVSDVTTINLDSSAEVFDNERFAKKFDAKTAYVKPLARRIDGKWKAEIVARNRFRLVRGAVAIKIVMRKDGKLLEASEVLPRQSGITDECVAVAKLAVQRAADPKSEPFPAELSSRETLEFVFTFLY